MTLPLQDNTNAGCICFYPHIFPMGKIQTVSQRISGFHVLLIHLRFHERLVLCASFQDFPILVDSGSDSGLSSRFLFPEQPGLIESEYQ